MFRTVTKDERFCHLVDTGIEAIAVPCVKKAKRARNQLYVTYKRLESHQTDLEGLAHEDIS